MSCTEKDDDYWMIYEAIETFLYGELDMSCTNEDGIFWGINNFYQVWEDMCNTWAFKEEGFNILYADTNIKINGNQVSNKKIGGHSLYCKEDFDVPFFIDFNKNKRWIRPDIVRLINDSLNDYNRTVHEVILHRYEKQSTIDFRIIKKPNGVDRLFTYLITELKKNKNRARVTSDNYFYSYSIKNFEQIKNEIKQRGRKLCIIIDWKYHDELFFKSSSDKLKKDITKQLCYEFTMSESLNNYKIETQFVIPNFEKNTDNIGDRIENASLFSGLKLNGIVVFKANFYMMQKAYLNHDE